MDSKFKFVADAVLRGKAYPALAKWQATPYTPGWRQFIQHWPYTVPADLHEHCQTHGFPYQLHTLTDTVEHDSFYTIAIGWFDFDTDYFSLLDKKIFSSLQKSNLRVLFYYDEGDNPYLIKQRLDQLCQRHRLSLDCYRFISANTMADSISNFVYFPSDELLYWHRNKEISPIPIHTKTREYQFTALSRTHKWWRATVMSDLKRHDVLDHSYWSYNTNVTTNDSPDDNPIEVDTLNIRNCVQEFVQGAPYVCDQLSTDQHNDHSMLVQEHFSNSYCSIVLETHFDADGSGGSFLTEKTFKCLKHGHPFVLVGPPNSLATLRKLGYRTFDHAIDNSYDQEQNNTRRWQMILESIEKIKKQNMHDWYMSCLDDITHNQQLFLQSKYDRLNTLYDKLLHVVATS
jgi:hypothetical protein